MPTGIYKRTEKNRTGFQKGHVVTQAVRDKISKTSLGHIVTLETRKKISIAQKGVKRGWGFWTGKKRGKMNKEWRKKIQLAHLGKVFTLERRKNISESKKGSKSHFWRGGISSENEKIRKSAQYRDWRTKVFQRDNYTCKICGSRGYELHADHIKPFAYYPELRLVIDNGRTLCVPCHKKTNTYGVKLKGRTIKK